MLSLCASAAALTRPCRRPSRSAARPSATQSASQLSPLPRPVAALVIAVALSSLDITCAQSQAEVRVSFSSPLHSYSHSHGSLAAHAVPSGPLAPQAPQQPSLPGDPISQSILLEDGPIRRGRLVQFVLPSETSESSDIDAIDIQGLTATAAVEDVDQELLQLPDPALLSRVLEGPLFFGAFPHAAALLRYQRAREAAGLAADRLGSARPESPFYRWPRAAGAATAARARGRRRSGPRRQWRTVY